MSEQKLRPGNYIGVSLPRPNAKRLLAGRGRYVDDLRLARMVHAACLRSPYAHARLVSIDVSAAAAAPGVVRVLTGADVAELCKPYVGVLTHVKTLRSAPQLPLVVDRARWQGEPVAFVVANTRAEAEDAAQLIEVEWEELPVVSDAEAALEPGSPVIHPELGDNRCFEYTVDTGNVDAIFAAADHVVEATFNTSRHTAVTLEPRSMIADFDPTEEQLTVWHATQAPYMMQWLIAHLFGLAEQRVRIVVPDVGGGFGLKIHTFGDELATVAAAIVLRRPVKFIADRLESFVSDYHARGHRTRARMALSKEGDILAFEADDLFGIGPYSNYPRSSANEGIQVVNLIGAPYKQRVYRGRTQAAFQNKAMYGQYRAVGHPIACMVTEALVDLGAAAVGMDPAEIRRRNYIPQSAYPYPLVSGPVLEGLSLHAAQDVLLGMMDYKVLRAEQAALRSGGVYRGIGLATFIESSNPGSHFGAGGGSISSQDGCTMKLTATGGITVNSSTNEIGQGAQAIVAQIAATHLGVPPDRIKVVLGDTDATPYGGGNTGSRGAGIGGEAVFQAGKALRANILSYAARLQESEPSLLDLRDGSVVEAGSGKTVMTLEQVARTAYFRPDTAKDFQPELTVTRSYAQKQFAGTYTNGIQASYVEVDADTGFVKLLKHWVVDDCGTVVNPMLVDEQIRGAVVQGIGAAFSEECIYSAEGQLLNGSLIDYLVPMAGEMPDIEVGHTCTPTRASELGAKGAGEAGTAGAAAAIMNAVNDALAPLNARVTTIPFTPERVLRALGRG
ncbi:MAG TPA: xanthine dehydrogenase family protein molybdopterin-binding subunit [Burkholderiales bacterium]|nr:xanthine dehydrogenase family protein molybdopterin-binding subunit [Burkholderiales bacterium]